MFCVLLLLFLLSWTICSGKSYKNLSRKVRLFSQSPWCSVNEHILTSRGRPSHVFIVKTLYVVFCYYCSFCHEPYVLVNLIKTSVVMYDYFHKVPGVRSKSIYWSHESGQVMSSCSRDDGLLALHAVYRYKNVASRRTLRAGYTSTNLKNRFWFALSLLLILLTLICSCAGSWRD